MITNLPWRMVNSWPMAHVCDLLDSSSHRKQVQTIFPVAQQTSPEPIERQETVK